MLQLVFTSSNLLATKMNKIFFLLEKNLSELYYAYNRRIRESNALSLYIYLYAWGRVFYSWNTLTSKLRYIKSFINLSFLFGEFLLWKHSLIFFSIIFFVGCSIHPLPEDYSGIDTEDIVRQIRCETRRALIEMTGKFLKEGDYVDNQSKEIGVIYFINKTKPLSEFSPNLFKGHVQDSLNVFWSTGIAYNFKLNMIENNNFSAGLGLADPFFRGPTNGAVSMAMGGSLNRQRGNTRTFTVTDSFGKLITKIPDDFCEKQIIGPNYIYPITGEIGMKEMLKTFVYLSIFGGLMGTEKDLSKPPTMVDALQFQTVILGQVNPTRVVFSPIRNTFALVDANLTAEVKRTDIHEVTVGLALNSAALSQLGPYRDFLFSRGVSRGEAQPMRSEQPRGALFGRLLTASGTPAEIAASEAVDQFLTQRLFSPTININP